MNNPSPERTRGDPHRHRPNRQLDPVAEHVAGHGARSALVSDVVRGREVTAAELYEEMVRFAHASGLRREELGSGWWWGDALENESGIGEAVEYLLQHEHKIDLRMAILDEPQEFWG